MNLQNFEEAFSAQILARGKGYYEDERVASVTQISDTNWQAEVAGSDIYIVDLVMDTQHKISYMDCDCPYEENCKHMAAVLYSIVNEYTPKSSVQTKTKTAPNMKKLLQQHTKEQLIELIMTLSKKHSAFKKDLELQLLPQENELEAAYNMIVHYRQSAQDRSGFIRWGQTSKAVKGVDLVHERIERHIEQGNSQLAIQLALLCLYQSMEMMECGDDSNGELGGAAESSIELVHQAIEQGGHELDEAQKKDILGQVEDAIFDESLQGWAEWQLDLLRACLPLSESPTCEQQILMIMSSLEQKHQQDSAGSYVQGNLERMKQLMGTMKLDDQEAASYLQQHPENHELRQRLINSAMQCGDYTFMLKLAEQGRKLVQSRMSGVNWKEFEFIAHQKLQHKSEARQLGEQLLLEGNGEYYELLKVMYEPKQWLIKRDQLLDQLQKGNSYLYGRLIVAEKLTARILAFCQKNTYLIDQHYTHLVGVYDQEAEAIFVEEISENALLASNRSQYSRVCQLIAVMQKAGYQKRAAEIVDTLKLQNKRRPAFIDELNRIS